MGHDKIATVSTSHSPVESIIGALSELENEIEGMNARVDEMKKRLMIQSNEEIEKLKQQIIAMATEEAKKIVDAAKAEADAESAMIAKEAEKSLATIKKNIDSSFDKAVGIVVKTVLGQEPTEAKVAPKKEKSMAEAKPATIKKYSSEGKPLN